MVKDPAQRLRHQISVRVDDEDKAWLDERAGLLTRTLPPGTATITASDVVRMCVAEKRAREAEGDRYVQQ